MNEILSLDNLSILAEAQKIVTCVESDKPICNKTNFNTTEEDTVSSVKDLTKQEPITVF